VHPVTEPERRGAVLKSLPGQFFLKEKFLPVPGAGSTDYAKAAPLLLGPGMETQKIKGVGMGVARHIQSVYGFIGIKKAFVSSDNNYRRSFREVITMKRYCIKNEPGKIEFIDILRETSDGFMIKVTRIRDGYEKTAEDFMPRHLFNICINTGYLYEVEKTAVA
jgi:hypothetical protein